MQTPRHHSLPSPLQVRRAGAGSCPRHRQQENPPDGAAAAPRHGLQPRRLQGPGLSTSPAAACARPSVCPSVCPSLASPLPALTTDLVKPHNGAWSPCVARAGAGVGAAAPACGEREGLGASPEGGGDAEPPRRGWSPGLCSGGLQCSSSLPVPPSPLSRVLQPLLLSGGVGCVCPPPPLPSSFQGTVGCLPLPGERVPLLPTPAPSPPRPPGGGDPHRGWLGRPL